ncbi:polyphosphate kinase [Rhodobacteraceae bacterium KLH11]|nr:polyphosphate kinase [Rhodobacteraceae bacterium KLH11]
MRWFILSLLCCLPLPALAHPHVFIDTGLEFLVDDAGNLTHVRVTWAYDEFYSLLVLEDMRLDQDADGVLTEAEEQFLSGFDAQWVEGYNGDLVIRMGEIDIPLSGPLEPQATTEDARIVTTHLRAIEGDPVPADALSIKAFDESFYTAYELNRPVTISGPSACEIARDDPDIDAELAQMQAFLLSLDADFDLEENDIPLVGEKFATEIKLSCPAT